MPEAVVVTGIGTDVGKSIATGWIAREINAHSEGDSDDSRQPVITQKLIQTGNKDMSEDIEAHRRIMGIPLQPRDLDHTTAPLILSYPASPELAARIDNVDVDFSIATESTRLLSEEYRHVLIEAAGGLLVPLKRRYLTIDYISDNDLPAIVVTNGQLGSINHTLLTLEVMRQRGIYVYAVVYNPYFDKDKVIAADTVEYLREWLDEMMPATKFVTMPENLLTRSTP